MSEPSSSSHKKSKSSSKSASSSKSKGTSKSSKRNLKSTEFIDAKDDEDDLPGEQTAALLRRYIPISHTLPEADWEAIANDPNLELWAVRVPGNLDLEALDDLVLPLLPSSSSSSRTSKASFTHESTPYDVQLTTPRPPKTTEDEDDDEEEEEGQLGTEMKSLTCLLSSRARNGGMYTAPKPFTHHLTISLSSTPSTSTSSSSHARTLPSILRSTTNHSTPSSQSQPQPKSQSKDQKGKIDTKPGARAIYPTTARPSQPMHLLKHAFTPIGSGLTIPVPVSASEPVDEPGSEKVEEAMELDAPAPLALSPESEKKSKKKAKRKHDEAVPEVEGEVEGTKSQEDVSPKVKKSKKLKTA